jgi:HK97 family phage portal protein
MGLLTALLPDATERRDRGVGQTASLSTSAGWLEDLLGGGVSTAGRRVTAQNATTVSAVYAGLRLMGSSLAQLPLSVMRRGEDGRRTELRNHRLWTLLNDAPNDDLTAIEFRELMTGWAILHGNAVAWLNLRNNLDIDEMIPLDPERVSYWLTPNETQLVVEYKLKSGRSEWIPRHAFMQLRAPLGNRWLGYGLLQLAKDAIGLTMVAEEHASRFYSNAAAPAGVLVTPKTLKPETFKRIKDQWNARHQGAENAFKTAVLEDGVEWKPLSLNLKDQQFLETRTFQVQEIARWIGVPPHLIGELTRSTNNNIESQGIEFVSYAIGPWAKRWEQRIALDCLGPSERRTAYLKHNFNAFLRGQTLDRYRAYQIGRMGGWLSSNDVRGFEDMDPIADGDTYMAPLNMVPADQFEDVNDPANSSQSDASQGDPGTQPGGTAPDLTRSARTMITAVTPMLFDVAHRAVRRAQGEQDRAKGQPMTAEAVEAHRSWCVRALAPIASGMASGIAGSVGRSLAPDDLQALVGVASAAAADQWTLRFRDHRLEAAEATAAAGEVLSQLITAHLALSLTTEP